MTSTAAGQWQSARARGLDNLVAAHQAVAGPGRGRRWLTTEINHALIVRLAAEFQGFCRDLHDEVIDKVLNAKLSSDPAMASIVRALLENGRSLDKGNANWGNIGSDFARLGLGLADALKTAHAATYPTWVQTMERLNEARNAIAHDDRVKLAASHAQQPLTLQTFRQWRTRLSSIVIALDAAVGEYLTDLNGVSPW